MTYKTILLSMLLIVLVVAMAFMSGCDSVSPDPCKRSFDSCNYNCGKGMLSSICQEKCTYQYNTCRKNR